MQIDPHVHWNVWNWEYGKRTVMESLLEEAQEVGIGRVFAMPNIKNPATGNPVIRRDDVKARLNFARQQGVLPYFRTFVGATSNTEQLEEAANIVCENPFVPGIKAYMIGKDNQQPDIEDIYQQLNIEEDKQKAVFTTLADCGYNEVLALHCEDSSEFRRVWDSKRPKSHCDARPLKAEFKSIKRNIDYARKTDFEGTLYFCHTTSSKCIELAKEAKEQGLKVAVEITPHHSLLSMDDMEALGMFGKMNTPLRKKKEQEGLLWSLKYETEIPITIGSDYARHDFFEKIRYPYKSGIGTYKPYKKIISEISSDPSVPNNRVIDLTYGNPVKIFGKKKCGIM